VATKFSEGEILQYFIPYFDKLKDDFPQNKKI
jgi:ribosomal protein S17E